MSRYLLKSIVFIALLLSLSCTKKKAYEIVAKEYLEANYVGNMDKAKLLCVPEAAQLFEYKKLTYLENPQFKTMNENATCHVVSSQLIDNKTAVVTLEENNVYVENMADEDSSKQVEVQETVINLVKRNNKWLVLIK